ncbi:T9SS type A sorting domain-containing protein [Saprospiraceae bacterium]|nr:T9SS type A sorting domain-containing protein [Saprospiraceae bacterium]
MKHILLLFIALLAFGNIDAQVTYTKDIAPIIYENCTSCHRSGEIAPLALTNYDEVSSWGNMIKYVTEIKYMPPWSPDPEFRHLLNERVLTEEQISLIGQWVDEGMVQGDPADEPDIPTFPTGSQIGTPDLVLEMAEEYMIEGNNQDDYRVFVIPTNFTEDTEIGSIEFRPGNNRAVHHALIGYDLSGKAADRDALSAEYGYTSFGDFGIDEAIYLSWTYVPGDIPLVYPEGIGQTIPAGADLLIQVHYAPLPTNETDKSSVNVFFKDADDPITREVKTGWVLPDNLPGGWNSFTIPPNVVKTFVAESFFEDMQWPPGANYDVSLIGVQPHSHLLGKSYEIVAQTPQNEEINIISIPDYDFNWQGSYSMTNMVKIPANSDWLTTAIYDNTLNNPSNPSNPPQFVTWGEGTEDEMLVVFFYYVPYQEGDEEIDLGGNIPTSNLQVNVETKSRLFPPSPNPTADQFNVSFYLETSENLVFEMYDISGRKIKTISNQQSWEAGFHKINVVPEAGFTGPHFIKMIGENYELTQKIILIK